MQPPGHPILLKAVALWLVVLAAAVANAALREKLLAPWLGRRPSLPLSGLLLSGLVLLISWVTMPFIGSSSEAVYHQVGLLWFLLTLSFELLLGRFLMRKPWREILQVFNLRKGDLFFLVLIATLVSPRLAAELQGLT